jgi:hypothetical protein
MTAPKSLQRTHPGSPGPSDHQVRQTIQDAEREGAEQEPQEAPPTLPRHAYETSSVDDRRKLADERIKNTETQRFQAEMDWEAAVAQLEAVRGWPDKNDTEIRGAEEAERSVRLRVRTYDAILERLIKFRKAKIR